MKTSMLKNKTIIITGGAGGLGSAFSLAVAKEGANLVILGRNFDKAQAFADGLIQQGYQAFAVSADVTHEESLKKAAQLIMDRFGSIDILINNAGGNHPDATTENRFASEDPSDLMRNFFKMKLDAMDDLLKLNILGTLLPTQVFASYMKKENHPSIINISSMSAYKPLTKIPTYSAAKAAINNLTQWLSVYFASAGIRVNAIAPGFFSTDQNRHLLKKQDGSLTDRSKLIIDHTPMGRFGEPEELVGTLLWLLNHQASGFVTGVIIPVDGGFSAFSGV
jgi:NAD(P)-dependent dehydrogenase (short-subunit alcohol dehydrogenase family)